MRPNFQDLSQAQKDAAYDNNRAVGNSAALIAERNAASAAFRKIHGAHLDVSYGARERAKFDLYPASDPNAPCFVFIHGGYWQRGQREDFAAFSAGIMAHGWSVAMPGYSLAPDVSLMQIVAEIDHALTWLRHSGPKHGLAAGPIVLSGWSAGAHLTALGLTHPDVAAGLAISGVFDLAPIRQTYLNDKLQLSPIEIAQLSPMLLPPVNKPLAIAYGTRELWPLVEDPRELHRLRAAAHAPGVLLPVAGADHFTILHELQRPDGILVRQLLALI